MSDVSSTCPEVRIKSDSIVITHDWNSSHDARISVEAYDLDAFIEELTVARDRLREAGVLTAWSRDADGNGNCGPVPSPDVR